MTMPVTADEDCIIAVSIRPSRKSTRASQVRKSFPLPMAMNILSMTGPIVGSEVTSETVKSIVYRPIKMRPRPESILPMRFVFSSLEKSVIISPRKAMRANIADMSNSATLPVAVASPTARAVIKAVMVVPMLAPIIIDAA